MSAPIVRADYDRLTAIAGNFSQQAGAIRQSLLQLSRQADTLQGGDWLGQGAQAFYAEMNSQIMPTMNRLVRALEAAAEITRQVNQTTQQAEAEAAACFKLDGASALSAVGAAGLAAVTGLGAVAAGMNALASSEGTGQGAAAAAGATPGLNGLGAGGGVSPAAASLHTPPDTSPTLRQQIETGAAGVGILATMISILESGGTVAAAGAGTTMGALLLPFAGFFLGTAIAESRERQEKALAEFRTKLTGSAMIDATDAARTRLQDNYMGSVQLNEQGRQAVAKHVSRWRTKMNQQINLDMMTGRFGGPKVVEKVLQAHYDEWVDGMANDLYAIYTDRKLVK